MNRKLALIAAAILILVPIGTVSAQYFISTYSSFTGWISIILLGVLVSLMLVGIYYMIGAVLGNQKVKTSALSMFVDVLGTIVIVVIVLFTLNYFGTTLSLAQFVPPQRMLTLCNQVGYGSTNSGPPVYFLNANSLTLTNWDGSAQLPEPAHVICNDIIAPQANGNGDITTNIDYGLASTYMIVDNLTNQTGGELDGLYYFENLIYFLRNYVVVYQLCDPITCAAPIPSPTPESQGDFAFATRVSFSYFNGYVLGRLITPYVTAEIDLMFYLYTIQLIGIIMILLLWPYMLAAGLLLRSFPWTRRMGGLLIATVIVGLLIYPAVYLFQYNALHNLTPLSPIGASSGSAGLSSPSVDALTLCGRSIQYQGFDWPGASEQLYGTTLAGVWCYTTASSLTANDIFRNNIPAGYTGPLSVNACAAGTQPSATQNCFIKRSYNFYVFPSDADVINLDTYYPNPNIGPNPGSSILNTEMSLSAQDIMGKGVDAFWHIFGLFGALGNANANINTAFPSFPVPIGPKNIMTTYLSLEDLYGYLAVPGYLIPILDILILMSAITGLSSILGGETQILGISRFI